MNSKKIAVVALMLMVCVPIGLGYALSVDETEHQAWQVVSEVNVSDAILNYATDYTSEYVGTTNNTQLSGGYFNYVETGSTPTSYPQTNATVHATALTAWSNYQIPYTTWSLVIPAMMGYYIGTSPYQSGDPVNTNMSFDTTFSSSEWPQGTTVYLMVTGSGTRTINITEYGTITSYANVVYGWYVSDDSVSWSNGQRNTSVRIMLELDDDTYTTIGDCRLSNHDGVVTAFRYSPVPDPERIDYVLGAYHYMMVDYRTDYATIYGLSEWPSYGVEPTTYNSVVVDLKTAYQEYSSLHIKDTTQTTVYRVDSATVIAGTFPSTKDYTLDVGGLYPGKSNTVKVNSIGVHGESLQIGTTTYNVSNGKIVVNGHSLPVKGLEISSRYNTDSEQYDISINDYGVGSSADPVTVYFGGEWSLTVSARILEETTTTSMDWSPGGFGLSKEGFIAAGLLTGVGVFVVLGMTGKYSGSKIAILGFVVGGAVVTYLLMA